MQKYFSLFLLFIMFAQAHAENICEKSFEREVVPISSEMRQAKVPSRWIDYATFLEKFGPCLDAGYAENVQSISEDALAKDWNGFVKFAKRGAISKEALAGIKDGFSIEMGNRENLKKIQKNAKGRCAKSILSFCEKIKRAKL